MTLEPSSSSQSASPTIPGRIFLVGFMGAGKTTVGRVLAQLLQHRFFDLDEIIEKDAGKSVRQIFTEDGELEFRRVEKKALESLQGTWDAVVALGGGAYAAEENRRLVRELGTAVWLECPLEVCMARLAGDESRPLLRTEQEMAQLMEE